MPQTPKTCSHRGFLFLTSSAFSNERLKSAFIKGLKKDPMKCKVAMFAIVEDAHIQHYVDFSLKQMKEMGFKDTIVFNIAKQVDPSNLADADVVYVCGGDTYAILKRLRENGLTEYVVNQVKKGAAFIGVSAGSIIAGPNIDIAGWGSEGDTNDVGLTDLTGLKLTDMIIYPHYRDDLKKEVDDYRKKTDFPVVALKDGEVVMIEDEATNIVRVG